MEVNFHQLGQVYQHGVVSVIELRQTGFLSVDILDEGCHILHVLSILAHLEQGEALENVRLQYLSPRHIDLALALQRILDVAIQVLGVFLFSGTLQGLLIEGTNSQSQIVIHLDAIHLVISIVNSILLVRCFLGKTSS